MATITELVEKHSKQPGDIMVTAGKYGYVFRPYFTFMEDGSLAWRGTSSKNPDDWNFDSADNWSLFVEPKPKVKRAQYLCIPIAQHEYQEPFTMREWFKDEQDLLNQTGLNKLDYDAFVRLEEREFDR